MPRQFVLAAVGVTVTAGAALLLLGSSASHQATPRAPATSSATRPVPARPAVAVQAPAGGVFGPMSVWKQQVVGAPVAAGSAAMITGLAAQVSSVYGGIAAFNAFGYNTSYYAAAADTPRTDVHWDNCQNKSGVPAGLLGPGGQFTGVPIPNGAVPAAGTDNELTVSDPSTDQLWELWQAKHESDGWHACWGGRIDHASTSPGYFQGDFGASASGLAISGGMIGIAEATAGVITHAMSLAIISPAAYPNYVYPAQRTDGDNPSAQAVPEGARLRLDPSVDVAALHLTPLASMVAKAAQTYGFIVTDSSGAVAVDTESGTAVKDKTGVDPWTTMLGTTPDYLVMRNFPWAHLQVVNEPRPPSS